MMSIVCRIKLDGSFVSLKEPNLLTFRSYDSSKVSTIVDTETGPGTTKRETTHTEGQILH